LKEERKKQQVIIKANNRITDFSTETIKARKAWKDIFQAIKEINCQSKLIYVAKISFIIDGEIKTPHDK
jgi:hypothetical protein